MHRNRFSSVTALALVGVVVLPLAACAPRVELAIAPGIHSTTWASAVSAGSADDADARAFAPLDWTAFGSPSLDRLLQQARAANTDVAIANARIAQAAADIRMARAANGPVLGLLARAESNARGGSAENAFRDSFNTAELDLSYTVDVSGQLRAGRKAAVARFRAAGYEAEAIQLGIEVAVATAYVEYATLTDRIAIAEAALNSARTFEQTIKLRASEGLASEVDAGIQTSQTNAFAVELSRLKEAKARSSNALAVLLGEEAPSFSLPDAGLATLVAPQFEPLQPASLLSRRPDMLFAAAMIEAAEGDVQRARAAFIPDLELSVGSFIDNAAGNSLTNPGFALASRLLATIFDNGRLNSGVYRSSAQQREAVEQFRKSMLTALAETQNALVASARSAERAALLQQSHGIAMRTAELARLRFISGSDDIGTVTEADRRRLEIADSLAIARQEALLSAIQLYAAMGGRPKMTVAKSL